MPLIDLANPSRFLALADRVLPWLAAATLLAFAFGISQAYLAPDDYQQGATVKIMFIHVPSAWLSMGVWALMTLAAAANRSARAQTIVIVMAPPLDRPVT